MSINSLASVTTIEAYSVYDPIRPDYANFDIDVRDSFNWAGIFDQIKIADSSIDDHVALFVFRSILKSDADVEILRKLDESALISAAEAEGFIHYEPFDGLSYCLWRTPEDARAAISTPEHMEAARYANLAYEDWHLLRFILRKPSDIEEAVVIEV